MAILVFFWLIKEINVFEIPIPAISMALIETKDKNSEKFEIKRFKLFAAFSGNLIL